MTRDDLLSRDEMFRAEACRALDEACRDAGVGTVSTVHGFTPCACIRHPDVFVESSWRPDSPAPRYRARLGGMVCQWTMSATEAHADALRLLSEVEARDRAVAEHAQRRRQATVRALRAAADAIERGAHESQIACEPMALSYDGVETFSALGEAEAWADDMIEPDDGEYHPDVEQVSWGIYVAVERAHVVVDGTPEDAAAARDHGYDEHWSVSLVDAWEDDSPTAVMARAVKLLDQAPSAKAPEHPAHDPLTCSCCLRYGAHIVELEEEHDELVELTEEIREAGRALAALVEDQVVSDPPAKRLVSTLRAWDEANGRWSCRESAGGNDDE